MVLSWHSCCIASQICIRQGTRSQNDSNGEDGGGRLQRASGHGLHGPRRAYQVSPADSRRRGGLNIFVSNRNFDILKGRFIELTIHRNMVLSKLRCIVSGKAPVERLKILLQIQGKGVGLVKYRIESEVSTCRKIGLTNLRYIELSKYGIVEVGIYRIGQGPRRAPQMSPADSRRRSGFSNIVSNRKIQYVEISYYRTCDISYRSRPASRASGISCRYREKVGYVMSYRIGSFDILKYRSIEISNLRCIVPVTAPVERRK